MARSGSEAQSSVGIDRWSAISKFSLLDKSMHPARRAPREPLRDAHNASCKIIREAYPQYAIQATTTSLERLRVLRIFFERWDRIRKLLDSGERGGGRAGESAPEKLAAPAARFLRTGNARLSEAIGGHVSAGDSYCFF